MDQAKSDPHAAVICALGYVGAYDTVVVSNGLHYTETREEPPHSATLYKDSTSASKFHEDIQQLRFHE